MRSLLILTVGLAFTVMVTPALAQGTPADEAAIVKAAEQFPAAWAKGKSAGGALHDGCGLREFNRPDGERAGGD